MEDLIKTWKTAAAWPPTVGAGAGALLVHIYPPGPSLGSCYALGDSPVVLGRGDACEIQARDGSVSRIHARIEPGDDGYHVADLGSTNGTFVNDAAVTAQPLCNGDYLRVGSRIYRFLAGGNIEAQYHEESYRLTILDGLTGIHNNRYLLEFLERELARAQRHCRPLAVVLFDLDFFKAVNDRWGHLAGDAVLRELAAVVKPTTRKTDLFARFAGEEFALVLPETAKDQALGAAERVRGLVEGHPFWIDGQAQRVTISGGVAVTAGEEPLTVSDLLREADYRLYQAKHAGRNRVIA